MTKKSFIRKAIENNEVLPCIIGGTLRILKYGTCVNSKWKAAWLEEGDDSCQCGFKCKVYIEISTNGDKPYQYVVDKSELYRLIQF